MAATPPNTPTVRRATHADVPRIGRLGALLVEEHHNFDSLRFLPGRPRTPADYGAFLATQLDNPDAILLVADDNGDVIGYAYGAVEGYDYMALRGPAGLLHDIIVEPAYRHHGVGHLLLEAMLKELEARGVPRVVLTTAEKNTDAQRLFEWAGFRRTMIEMTREF